MITTMTTSGSWTNVTITFGPTEPPPAPAAQPARPRTPPGAPPVLAARQAPDGAWEVPARSSVDLVPMAMGAV